MEYSDNEYIKLNRKIKNWRWFSDVNTAHFFVYCLLSANWKEGYFKDKKVERGQFIRTYMNMSAESGLSVQNIRTAIKHLISTGEITVNLTGNGRGATLVITVVNYEKYQQCNTKNNTLSNNQLTTNQHESNNQSTQIEEVKNIRTKEVKNNKPPLSPLGEMIEKTDYTKTLKDKLHDWLKYKSEKKQSYKPTGFKMLLKRIDDVVKSSGEQAVIDAIDASMSNNWQGLFFDKFIIDTTSVPKQQTFNMDEFLKRYDE